MEQPIALHAALGGPPLDCLLPVAGSPAWASVRALIDRVFEEHCITRMVRSPSALWLLLRGRTLPRGATWGDLLDGRTLEHLLGAARADLAPAGLAIASWNVRWAVSPHTPQAAAKREQLRRWLEAGRPVLLQETHWRQEDVAVWRTLLPAATVIASAATDGPRGGPQGGVAILLPPAYQAVGAPLRVPGCAVAVEVAGPHGRLRLVSLYLPPGRQDEALGATEALIPAEGPPLVVAGDINTQMDEPREGEEERVARLRSFLEERGAIPVDGPRITRRGRQGTCLDLIAAPATQAWRWSARAVWHAALSDHAGLLAGDSAHGASAARALNPAAMRALPEAALVDLRRRYRCLERVFQLPAVDVAMGAAGGVHPAAPVGELPGGHVALSDEQPGDAHGQETAGGEAPPLEDDPEVPFLPAMMWMGRPALTAMIRGWWRTWQRRRGGASAGQVLHRIAASGEPGRPQGPLAAWLEAMGWAGGEISPDQAAVWLRLWQNEQAQTGAAALRPWQRGPGAGRPTRADQYRIGRQLFQRRHAVDGVRDAAGQWHSDALGMERVLWESRASIWGTAPALPASAEALLAAYFHQRRGFSAMPRSHAGAGSSGWSLDPAGARQAWMGSPTRHTIQAHASWPACSGRPCTPRRSTMTLCWPPLDPRWTSWSGFSSTTAPRARRGCALFSSPRASAGYSASSSPRRSDRRWNHS